MHPQQKHARLNLIVIAAALVLVAVAYVLIVTFLGPKGSLAALGFLGICGFLGFGERFYRKPKGSTAVVMDERDEEIWRRATVVAWGVSWLVWGVLCMGPWMTVAFGQGIDKTREALIPVGWLPLIYMGMFLLHTAVWSFAILVLYGKGADVSET